MLDTKFLVLESMSNRKHHQILFKHLILNFKYKKWEMFEKAFMCMSLVSCHMHKNFSQYMTGKCHANP